MRRMERRRESDPDRGCKAAPVLPGVTGDVRRVLTGAEVSSRGTNSY